MTRREWLAFAASAAALPAAEDPAVSMIPVTGEGANYWPRWRGPSGQGLVAGSGYVDKWSDTENVLWKTPVPGRGHSSPIVWKDRIFLVTAYEEQNKRSLLCFNRATGKLLWETEAPAAVFESKYKKNSFASPTPATDGNLIYCYLGHHGGLVAFDFQGKIAWKRSLGELTAYHGIGGSPLLYQDRVILYQDQRKPGESFVAAFRKSDGEPVWRTPREEQVGWGTAAAIRAGSRDEIVVSSMRRVYAYAPDTGQELWRVDGNLFEVIPTPVAGDGMVFCCSGRAGPTLAIRPGGSGNVTQSHVAWQTPKGSPFVPSPLLYKGLLYMVNDMQSIATCFEAKSGRLLWQGRMGEAAREGFSASPVGFDGRIFFTNDQGETYVLEAGDEFQVRHVNQLNDGVIASPALMDGVWYQRTFTHLYAIGKRA